MFKLVVLSVIVALVSAKPSHWAGEVPVAYSAGPAIAYSQGHAVVGSVPTAVSHQSRTDVHSSPAIVSTHVEAPVAYAAPQQLVAPVAYSAAPAVAYSQGHAVVGSVPTAVSHQSRTDVHSSPAIVSTHVEAPVAYAAPQQYAAPVAYSAGPAVAYSQGHAVVGSVPTAVSHQSRTDVHSSPAIVSTHVEAPIAYAAPQQLVAPVAYSAPAVAQTVQYASEPVITGYSASILKPNLVSHAYAAAPAVAYSQGHAVVGSVPTAVSHQSRTDVHSKSAIISQQVQVPQWGYAATPVAYSHGYAHGAPVEVNSW